MNYQEEEPGFLGSQFDGLGAEPPIGGWQRLQTELAPDKPSRPVAAWWQIAAAVALLMSASLLVWQPWDNTNGMIADNQLESSSNSVLQSPLRVEERGRRMATPTTNDSPIISQSNTNEEPIIDQRNTNETPTKHQRNTNVKAPQLAVGEAYVKSNDFSVTNNLSDTETNSKAIALNRFKKHNSPVLATSRNAKQSRVATTFNSRGLQPTDASGNPSSRVATIQPVDNEANIEPELAIGTVVNQANVTENDTRMEEADLMTPRYQQSIAPYPLASATPLLVAQDKPHKQASRYYIALSPRLTWQQSLYKVQTTTESGTQTLTPNRQDNPGLELALRGGVALRSWLSTGIEIGVNRFASRYTTYVTNPISNQSIVTNRSTNNSYSIDALPGVVDVPTEQKQLDVRAQLNTQAFIDLHPNHRRYGLDLGAGFSTGIYQGLTTTIAGSSNTLRQPTGQVQPMGQALAYIRLWQHGNNSLRIEGGLRIAPDRYQTAGEGVSVHRRQAVAGLQLHF